MWVCMFAGAHPKELVMGYFFLIWKRNLKLYRNKVKIVCTNTAVESDFLRKQLYMFLFSFFSWYRITCGSCSPNLRLMVSLSRNTATNSFCPLPSEWIRCRGITENNVSILQKLLFQHLREGKPNPFSKSKVSETEWNTTEGHKTHHACCRDGFIRRMNCACSPLLLFPSY